MRPIILTIVFIACFAVSRSSAQVQQTTDPLVAQLMRDHIVDEAKGFIVEKKQNKLYINGQLQTDAVANKYLPLTKEAVLHYRVFSLQDRINMHPDASLIQVLSPVSFSSPCVDKGKKPGC